jgi:hypothetical protein
MVKLGKLRNVFTMPTMRIKPDVTSGLNALNARWGLLDEADQKFRVENNVIVIGKNKVSLDAFNKLSTTAKVDFMNSPDNFDLSVRTKMDAALDANFVDIEVRTKALELGKTSMESFKSKVTVNGEIVTTSTSWTGVMDKLNKLFLAAAGVWGLVALNNLLEGNTGCFLVGPDGEKERVGNGTDCNCVGDTNPLRTTCCTACKVGGDDSLICPDDVASDKWTDPYVCPGDTQEGNAPRRGVRSAISVSAAASLARATALAKPATAASSVDVTAAAASTCTSCGCDVAGEWKLCVETSDIFDTIADLFAGAGEFLEEGADGLFELVKAPLDFLSGIGDAFKNVFVYVAIAVGVGVVVTVAVLVARAVKKKKKQRLEGGDVRRLLADLRWLQQRAS